MSLMKYILILGFSITAFHSKSKASESNCFHYNSDRFTKTKLPFAMNVTKISTNGKFAAGSNQNNKTLYWIDLENNKTNQFNLGLNKNFHIETLAASDDGSRIFYKIQEQIGQQVKFYLKILDIQNGANISSFELGSDREIRISPNQQLISYLNYNAKEDNYILSLLDIKNNIVKKFTLGRYESLLSISDKSAIISSKDKDFKIINFKDGTEKIIKNSTGYDPYAGRLSSAFSSDQNHFANIGYLNNRSILISIDLKKNKIKSVDYTFNGDVYVGFYTDSNKIFLASEYALKIDKKKPSHIRFTWDPASDISKIKKVDNTFEVVNYDLQFWSNGYKEQQVFSNWYEQAERTDEYCAETDFNILPSDNLKNSCQSSSTTGDTTSDLICSDTKVADLCNQSITPNSLKQWDSLLSIENKELTHRQAELLLLRFSKPGGFDQKRDLSFLLAILKSNNFAPNSTEIQRALQGVLHTSNSLYKKLLDEFPMLLKLNPKSDSTNQKVCRTFPENEILKADAENYLNLLLTGSPKNANFSYWEPLAPLGELYKNLPLSQQKDLTDIIAQSLTDYFLDTHRYSKVINHTMESKIYNFTLQKVLGLFGKKLPNLNDFTYARLKNSIAPIVMSTGEMKNLSSQIIDSQVGFYYSLLPHSYFDPKTPIGKTVVDVEANWVVDGKSYHGKIISKISGASADIIPVAASPDYNALRKDGKLTGMFIVASNQRENIPNYLFEYKTYLSKKEFQFEGDPQTIASVKEFIKLKIVSGEADYMIKEDHLGGNLDDIMVMHQKGFYEVATNKKTKEMVYIIYTDSKDKSKGDIISNREFSEWFKIRLAKKAGKNDGQFLLINGSCSSNGGTIRQIEAIKSNKFMPIPTTGNTTGLFGMGDDFAESPILDGIRNGKSFDFIRQELDAMEVNAHTKKQRLSFLFVFPNEKQFQERVSDFLSVPLETNLILTEDEKPYSPLTLQESN